MEKHGFAHRHMQHPLYKIWMFMKSRCNNPKDTSFKNYGARGISVCAEWNDDPVSFIAWCNKNGWKEGLFLDRKDNDGNYEPSNCRFVNRIESNTNQRIRRDNTSGYRGVHYRAKYRHWVGRIQINRNRIELCWEKTAKEAAIIRDKFIIKNGLPHLLSFPELAKGGAD